GREALRCGRGGIRRMVETSGLSKPTILKGIRELSVNSKLVAEEGRVRKPGAGRKPVEEHDPEITRLLEQVMEESTVGNPMSPLKWNSKSSYQIRESEPSATPSKSRMELFATASLSVAETFCSPRRRDLTRAGQSSAQPKQLSPRAGEPTQPPAARVPAP